MTSASFAISLRVLPLLTLLLLACTHGPTSLEGRLEGRIEAPGVVRLGEIAAFHFVATNTTKGTVDLEFGKRARSSLVVRVRNERGTIVWTQEPSALLGEPAETRRLEPNASVKVSTVWDLRGTDRQPVAPGKYFVNADLLLANNQLLKAKNTPVEIVVNPN